jgi:hypothetical protein
MLINTTRIGVDRARHGLGDAHVDEISGFVFPPIRVLFSRIRSYMTMYR